MTYFQPHWTILLILVAIHTGCVNTYNKPPSNAEILEISMRHSGLSPDYTLRKAPVTVDRVQVMIQAGHATGIHAVAVSPNGRYIASAAADGLKLWDVASGQQIRTIQTFPGLRHVVSYFVSFSEDSSQVKVVAEVGMSMGTHVETFEVISGKKVMGRGGVFSQELAITLSPDGPFETAVKEKYGLKKISPSFIDHLTGKAISTVPAYGRRLAISQDGKTLLTMHETDIISSLNFPIGLKKESENSTNKQVLLVWDLASSTLRRILPDSAALAWETLHRSAVLERATLKISPDGRYVFTEGISMGPQKVSVYDIETGRLALTFTGIASVVNFSSDGKMLAFVSGDGTVKLLELSSGREVETFQGSAVNFTPDGRTLVVGAVKGGAPFLRDLVSGEETRLRGGSSRVTDLALVPDGRSAVAGMEEGSAKLWDLTTGILIRSFDCPSGMAVTSVAVSSAMPVLATGCRDGSAWLWDLATGRQLQKLLPSLPSDKRILTSRYFSVILRVSQDGRTLVMSRFDQLVFWDLVSGKEVRRITVLPTTPVPSFPTFENSVPLSQKEAIAIDESWITKWISSLAMHPNGQLVAARRADNSITLWDLRTGQKVYSDADTGNVEYIWSTWDDVTLYDAEGNPFLSGGEDGSLRVWSRPDTRELAALIALGREDFVTITPDLYYRASKTRIKGVAFRVGDQLYPFEQFDLRFNRPDIVLARLGLASPELIQTYRLTYEKRLRKMGVTEQMLGRDFHLPEVEVLTTDVPASVDTATLTLRVKVTDKKYPLDRLNVFVNDIPIHGTTGLPLPTKQTQTHEQDLQIPLVVGRNKIQVSVLNQQGVESLRQTVYTVSTVQVAPPEVYVVAIGVSEYQNKAYNLRYAAKDAQDFLKTYKAIEQRPGTKSRVHVLDLTNQKATRPEILKAKDWLKQSKINDLVVVFAAGHGMTDSQSNYYFGTHDIDPTQPGMKGLPYEEFENLLDGIPALQKLLLLDTCFSGEIDKDQAVVVAKAEAGGSGTVKMRAFKAARGVTVVVGESEASAGTTNAPRLSPNLVTFQQDWFADLRRGTGAAVISSSSGNEYSFEGEQWKNGVFTYALLNGLKNHGADANKDLTITVSELQGYVIDQVRTLTQGGQNPTVRHENLEYDFAVY